MLYGVSLTSAVAAGVIMASIPACVAVMSWVFLRERISLRVWLAVACAVLGISLVSLSKSELLTLLFTGLEADLPAKTGAQTSLLGNLLVFAAVLCEAAYAVIGKKLVGVLGPKRITSLVNLWGLALVTPFGLYQAIGFNFSAVPPATWLLLLFYALAASVWTVWLWMTGLKTVASSQAGVFTVMLPISAAAVGVLWLGERMGAVQVLAFGIALVGMLLVTLGKDSRDH
jgi:drug/metabolite transporter (DMT)-like permease